MNYYDTFLTVAPDCPVSVAVIPTSRREQPSIPQMEYELLVAGPYVYTQEELLFAVHVEREGIAKVELKRQRESMWDEYFSKPRACLRASMLPKKYGWGLHFDPDGLIALVAVQSAKYQAFSQGKGVAAVIAAMRNKRA